MEKELRISLFEPGMSAMHRIGLAGLFMTLNRFDADGVVVGHSSSWELSGDRVVLRWEGSDREFLDKLLRKAFSHDREGLIDFYAHRAVRLGVLQRLHLHEALLMSFLQHNKQNRIARGAKKTIVETLEGIPVPLTYRPFQCPFAHATAAEKELTTKEGHLRNQIPIKGWFFPGAVKRHEAITNSEIEESPARALALLFAPVACLYVRLRHRSPDGTDDPRQGVAIVVPHVSDLERYSRAFCRYLESPVVNLYADGLGDAALSALVALKAQERLDALGVSGCTVVTMGSVAWNKQQKRRVAVFTLEGLNDAQMEAFETVLRELPNRPRVWEKRDGSHAYFVFTSVARGLIAGNVAGGRDWYCGFSKLMSSRIQAADLTRFERGGLSALVDDEAIWVDEVSRQFVKAVHLAIRNRYGALAAQTPAGQEPPFQREFERMRVGFMRCKNKNALRGELADLFARARPNRVLQREWQKLVPLMTGDDWQKVRDLALFALASYSGPGAGESVRPETEFSPEELGQTEVDFAEEGEEREEDI